MSRPELAVAELTHLQRRCVLEAVESAATTFWERRALDFEQARPRPGEFHGRASRAELSLRWRRLTVIADACRAKAALVNRGLDADELEVILEQVTAEVAA